MLQYDLSETTLARAPFPIRPPGEAELLAVTLALLVVHDCSVSDLDHRVLTLRLEDLDRIQQEIATRLSPLTRDIGQGEQLRRRLRQLVGLRISQMAFPMPS